MTETPTVRVNADGSVTLQDGSKQLPDTVSLVKPDGTVAFPDGSVRLASGDIQLASGGVVPAAQTPTVPPGAVVMADGSVQLASGDVVLPSGNLLRSDGNVVDSATGSVTLPTFAQPVLDVPLFIPTTPPSVDRPSPMPTSVPSALPSPLPSAEATPLPSRAVPTPGSMEALALAFTMFLLGDVAGWTAEDGRGCEVQVAVAAGMPLPLVKARSALPFARKTPCPFLHTQCHTHITQPPNPFLPADKPSCPLLPPLKAWMTRTEHAAFA